MVRLRLLLLFCLGWGRALAALRSSPSDPNLISLSLILKSANSVKSFLHAILDPNINPDPHQVPYNR